MKIAVVQFCPEFGKKEANVEKIKSYINTIDSDIIVFPELAISGYYFLSREEAAKQAERFDGEVISDFQLLAEKLGKTIVVGFPENEGDKTYNSAAILLPDKTLSRVYRKTHLFYRERFCFDEGDTGFFVIEDKEHDLNIGTMICYDWRFPESARSLGLQGADLIVAPSNLVTDVWHKAMPARALDNKVYLAVANRTGTEVRNGEELFFKGESAIYKYNGDIIAKAGVHDETVIIAEIEPEKTRSKSFNEFNDIFRDRRPEKYSF